MSLYCHQVSYTSEAWSRIIRTANDRFEAIRAPIENLGGIFRAAFFTSGRFDVLAITEFPDSVTPADISTAFARGGAVASIQTITLLTPNEAIELHTHAPEPVYCAYPRKRAMAAQIGR